MTLAVTVKLSCSRCGVEYEGDVELEKNERDGVMVESWLEMPEGWHALGTSDGPRVTVWEDLCSACYRKWIDEQPEGDVWMA